MSLLSLSSFFGCAPSQSSPRGNPDFEEVAIRIVKAFEDDSIHPIEDILSQSALETSDLMEGIHYGNSLLKGSKKAKIEKKSCVEGDLFLHGKQAKDFACTFYVLTEERDYRLSFQYFVMIEIYPQDYGLYRIHFEDEETYMEGVAKFQRDKENDIGPLHWNYGATYERAGIYNPKWQTTPPPNGDTSQRY